MKTPDPSDDRSARILRAFVEFIEYHESNAKQTWSGSTLFIQHTRQRQNAISFCRAEDAVDEVQRLGELARLISSEEKNHELFDRLEVYWVGRSAPITLKDIGLPVLFHASSVDEAWTRRPRLLNDESELGEYVRSAYADRIRTELQDLPVGNGPAHEKLLRKILYFALNPIIRTIFSGVASAQSRSKRDILISLTLKSQLHEYFRGEGLNSNRIVVEAKNQERETEDDIRQISDYISEWQVASVGLFVTRQPVSDHIFKSIAERRTRSRGKSIILPLSDKELFLMIDNAEQGHFDWNENLLMDICDAVQAATP